MVKSIRCSNPK